MNVPVKTTPQNVDEANNALFSSKMNLPAAAAHCGMTHKEMKMTFREFLKYHPPDWDNSTTVSTEVSLIGSFVMIQETHGGF
jgi:hypothetical protein